MSREFYLSPSYGDYRPDQLRKMSKNALISEYDRLRKQARADITAIRSAGWKGSRGGFHRYFSGGNRVLDRYGNKFRGQGKYMNKRQLAYNLAELRNFFQDDYTTVDAQIAVRRQGQQTLNDIYKDELQKIGQPDLFYNDEFYSKFTELMSDLSDQYGGKIPDSDIVAADAIPQIFDRVPIARIIDKVNATAQASTN